MNPDIVFVSGLGLLETDKMMPQFGQIILQRILAPHYTVKLVNFEELVAMKTWHYEPSYDDTIERMAEYLLSFGARLIGFYTICDNFINVAKLSERIHALSPSTLITFGGPHATLTWEACLKTFPFVSAISVGESEYSIIPLMKTLLEGGSLAEVPGIAYRDGEGRPVRNLPCDLVPAEDLYQYAVFDMEGMIKPGVAPMYIEGGRGCPFQCSFCATSVFWKRRFRVKPVEDLIREMDMHHDRSGFRRFSIQHDIFTANRKHLKSFCQTLIDRGSPYGWSCSSRIDVLDEEVIRLMAQSGCETVFLGIETGSPRMQKLINKNLNLNDAVRKIMLMEQVGIDVEASFIYGLVDETEVDFFMTLEMLRQFFLAGVTNTQLHRYFVLPATKDEERIRDQLYFDENEIDMSIAGRKSLTPENRARILAHPELFTHFFTFKNPVRQKYRWADSLSFFTNNLSIDHPKTARMLMRRMDYLQLYQKYEDKFRQLSVCFSMEGFLPLKRLVEKFGREVIEAENVPEMTEMYRYEEDVKQFLQSGQKDMRLVTYQMDIYTAIREERYVMKPFRAALSLDPASARVKLTPLPDWLHLE